MVKCSKKLPQNSTVSGEVSLTCNAWQASNTDGYFAVMGHWVEEMSQGSWNIKSTLLGFTWMNNSHNGKCLGQALFKIVDRLGISNKVQICAYSLNITTEVSK